MRLRTKLLITYFLFFIPAFFYLTAGYQDELKFRYLEGVEETLVDESRILAGLIALEMEQGEFTAEELGSIFKTVYQDRFSARIYQLLKTRVDTRIYITDTRGILIFDSFGWDRPGTDYSRWRDVLLTLQGEYGARSSKDDPGRPEMSTLYVAAPLVVNGETIGVLTIGKPTENINGFLKLAKKQVLKRSVIAALLALVLSILAMFFITRPLDHLRQYVKSVREGNQTDRPSFGKSDIGDVGRAFEKVRADLEAKEYVEAYVQSLTHEIKSPVAAIAGAAELLAEEGVPAAQKKRFLSNIRGESKRIQVLVDRMLALCALEHRDALEHRKPVCLITVLTDVLMHNEQEIENRNLLIIKDLDPECNCVGDGFLINQAVQNIFQNAVQFSPKDGKISIALKRRKENVIVEITDQGPGIPEFAREKIFDRFFSIQRPNTHKKSTGLGLNFVREIALLHGGSIHVENNSNRGAKAVLILPAN